MQKIETKIKNKERSIERARKKIKSIECKMKGLEEARMFCAINKDDTIENGRYTSKIDLDTYRYCDSWPVSVGGKNENGSITFFSFSERCYYPDKDEFEVSINRRDLFTINEYYPQMYESFDTRLQEEKRKLGRSYEEYGKLVYDFKMEMK
ncbi:MAG: hypothetical protein IJM23_06270 [Lachnospiraceae bacterium]|nr:hypothetical protein [Lachnospiraceae bacterium]